MKSRVTVTIGGQQYTILSPDGEEYIEKIADYVDGKLKETVQDDKMAAIEGAILTAMNIADEKFKEQEISENLRRQIKEILEESSKLKSELSESKREVFRLQQKLDKQSAGK